MTIKNLIEKYEKTIENLTDGMSLFENESSAIRAGYLDQIEIYETVIADLQDLAQKQGDLISREALKKAFEDTVCIEPMPYAFVKQIIDNAPTVSPKLSDEQIEKITDLLEIEWGYEGIREDVSRILRGADHETG